MGNTNSLKGGLPSNSLSAPNDKNSFLIAPDDRILVTGAAGFIGRRVVGALLDRGYRNLVCLARPSSQMSGLEAIIQRRPPGVQIELLKGNLLSRDDCEQATRSVAVIYHLAAGIREKSFHKAFENSVTTTRNLLEATLPQGCLKRFVNVSSFAVYTNRDKPQPGLLDETCPIEEQPELRGEAYCFAKVKQDQLVIEYGRKHGIPYVLVRPGVVYGPGNTGITSRVGSRALGIFLHLGGSNVIPFTYIDNCADAIVLAGIRRGVDGQVFNVVDDNLPTSRQFLHLYKRNARAFASVPVPRAVSYALCFLWEKFSTLSNGKLPPIVNRRAWHAYWQGSSYSNAKLKSLLGWTPRVSTAEGLKRYFEACRQGEHDVV